MDLTNYFSILEFEETFDTLNELYELRKNLKPRIDCILRREIKKVRCKIPELEIEEASKKLYSKYHTLVSGYINQILKKFNN